MRISLAWPPPWLRFLPWFKPKGDTAHVPHADASATHDATAPEPLTPRGGQEPDGLLLHAADLPVVDDAITRPPEIEGASARPAPNPINGEPVPANKEGPRKRGWLQRAGSATASSDGKSGKAATSGQTAREAKQARRRARADQRKLKAQDLAFLDSVKAAQVVEAHPHVSFSVYLMLATVIAAGAWSASTHVDLVTRTEARVVPEGREQIISSLEGGLLAELLVHDGEAVHTGQVLVRLDPTRLASQQSEGEAKRLALLATQARLVAESRSQALIFPAELDKFPDLQRTEREAYMDRRRVLAEAVSALDYSIMLLRRELQMAEMMASQGLMSEVEVMRLRRQISDLRQAAAERRGRYRQEASTQLLQVQTELAQLQQQQLARDDAVRRTELTSPVDGIVKNIRARTTGGVVAAGAPILEIVPRGQRLLIEARVKPSDMGFVRVGQAAEIKLSAYDYNLYGGLKGVVETISPDALGDTERSNGGPDATWFRALVRVERSTLQGPEGPLPVHPGMTGTVEIITGQRTVLAFVLRPLLKVQEAFRER
jgi:membrane fusion protein, adhesin transport system